MTPATTFDRAACHTSCNGPNIVPIVHMQLLTSNTSVQSQIVSSGFYSGGLRRTPNVLFMIWKYAKISVIVN